MYVVFKDKQVNFSGQAEEKINFFYRYPELTELRNVMRSRLHNVIVNSQFSLPE
ncbi:MAG: hypothetical protein ACJA2Z_000220 [Candidatus Paceibacteria bacterium]|jgi:hypothetical protein